MKRESTHSQDYDRKHDRDHNVRGKAALKSEFSDNKHKRDFIERKRLDAGKKDRSHPVRTPDGGKQSL